MTNNFDLINKITFFIKVYTNKALIRLVPRSPARRARARAPARRGRAACAWTRPSTRCSCRAATSCAATTARPGACHATTLSYATQHYTSIYYNTLYCTTLHFNTLHYNTLHYGIHATVHFHI